MTRQVDVVSEDPNVRYVTAEELSAEIKEILTEYPWFDEYPISCHRSCARWEISGEHGWEAGLAWEKYDNALWLLTGGTRDTSRLA